MMYEDMKYLRMAITNVHFGTFYNTILFHFKANLIGDSYVATYFINFISMYV